MDPLRPNVVTHDLVGDPLVSVDALAEAAARVAPEKVSHHLGNMPVVSPEGNSRHLPLAPADIVRGLADNGCWLMIRDLALLPEYRELLEHHARAFEFALRARGEIPVRHSLIAFVASPGAVVPVHYDRNHHLLAQAQGTKHVGVGRFRDEQEQQRQLERGMYAERLNADAVPDDHEVFALQAGDALVIPAYTFHWVNVGDEVSVALTFAATTEATQRAVDVHTMNGHLRRIGMKPSGPGDERNDRWKERVLARSRAMRGLTRRG
ncbi:MAG: cupin domain-containing protein [Acidimicrobiia bacterium]